MQGRPCRRQNLFVNLGRALSSHRSRAEDNNRTPGIVIVIALIFSVT